jgi:hypothetical protein
MITAVGEGVGGLAGDLTVIALQSLPLSGISAKADGSASRVAPPLGCRNGQPGNQQ